MNVDDRTNGERKYATRIAMPWEGHAVAEFHGPDGLEVILTLRFDVFDVPDLVGVAVQVAKGWGVVGQAIMRSIPLSELQGLFMDHWYEKYPPQLVGWEDYRETGKIPADVRAEWPRGDKHKIIPYVQAVYNSAVARRLPATVAVGEAFGVSKATAGRIVDYVRQNGKLVDPVSYPRKQRKKDTKDDSGSSTE